MISKLPRVSNPMTPTIAESYMSETIRLLAFSAFLKCAKTGMLINAILIRINKGVFIAWFAFFNPTRLT